MPFLSKIPNLIIYDFEIGTWEQSRIHECFSFFCENFSPVELRPTKWNLELGIFYSLSFLSFSLKAATNPRMLLIFSRKFLTGRIETNKNWNLVLGVWCLVLGIWSLVLGAWCLVLGNWNLEFGAWCLEFSVLIGN